MIMQIVKVPGKSLRKKSKPVTKVDDKIKKLVADMIETLEAQTDPEGIGLAAPQVGINKQIFIMKFSEDDAKKHGESSLTKVVINPEIVSVSEVDKKIKKKGPKIMEGCLSLPHFYGPLVRSNKVTLKYLDENGKSITQDFNGLPAQIVLHETDHLNGVIFIDRLLEQKQPLYEFKNNEWHEVELI